MARVSVNFTSDLLALARVSGLITQQSSVLKIAVIVLYANVHLTETKDHSREAIKVVKLVT